MQTALRFLLVPLLFLAFAPISPAVTIWDNGVPNQLNALFSESNAIQQIGDNFTVGTTATATQINWWGAYRAGNTPTAPDDFTIRFFNIVAGVPDTVPFLSYALGNNVGRVDSGLDGPSFDIYAYSATIPDTLLAPGNYLLSIVNNTAADADDDWAWATSSSSGLLAFRGSDGQAWAVGLGEVAFNIQGTINGDGNGTAVPDTGTAAVLFGFGIAGLFFGQRRLEAVNRGLRG